MLRIAVTKLLIPVAKLKPESSKALIRSVSNRGTWIGLALLIFAPTPVETTVPSE
jgi:hypothetical protein